MIRKEDGCFSKETHMEEQVKVRIAAEAEVGVEEERISNQE
jgi:hypothetical protein